MIREVAVTLYLCLFRCLFIVCKVFPLKRKTIFMSYLGFNVLHTVEALEKESDESIVIVQTKHTRVSFDQIGHRKIIQLTRFNPFNTIRYIYHLATSDRVFVDNYYGFLAVTSFKKKVKCIQLWHAAGAVKKFGLTDASITYRSKRANKRFRLVYGRFDHVVVGCEKMADIFAESFEIPKSRMLKTGVPRTDFFFDEGKKEKVRADLYEKFPVLQKKKVILYTPTFREGQKSAEDIPFSIEQMKNELQDDYVLIVKFHPVLANVMGEKYPDFVLDLTQYPDVNHLLLISDILISDYSSIPFEFALLERPMIFYPYDLTDYLSERGIWGDYETLIGGPIAKNTEEIITLIHQESFDKEQLLAFKNTWNTYSTGRSSEQLIDALYKKNRA